MEEATRTLFHDALSKSDNPATRALADVVTAAPEGRVACWGDLVAYVRDHFQHDDDSIALWHVLTAVGDRRPQLLFLDLHRTRPIVLRSILADATRVPPIVQCALVSMPEAEPLLANLPEGIARPRARSPRARPRSACASARCTSRIWARSACSGRPPRTLKKPSFVTSPR